jgi:hypothetical protein
LTGTAAIAICGRGRARLGHRPRGRDASMNRIEKFFGLQNEAKVRFLDGEFEVLSPGEFVRCAVTGKAITLADLRYWSVDQQEAYATAEASVQRYLDIHKMAQG